MLAGLTSLFVSAGAVSTIWEAQFFVIWVSRYADHLALWLPPVKCHRQPQLVIAALKLPPFTEASWDLGEEPLFRSHLQEIPQQWNSHSLQKHQSYSWAFFLTKKAQPTRGKITCLQSLLSAIILSIHFPFYFKREKERGGLSKVASIWTLLSLAMAKERKKICPGSCKEVLYTK